jgi:hypothetical protein
VLVQEKRQLAPSREHVVARLAEVEPAPAQVILEEAIEVVVEAVVEVAVEVVTEVAVEVVVEAVTEVVVEEATEVPSRVHVVAAEQVLEKAE